MYCNQTGCDSAQDYIEIIALSPTNKNGARASSSSKRLYLRDVQTENKWVSNSLDFLVTDDADNDLTVIIFKSQPFFLILKILTLFLR